MGQWSWLLSRKELLQVWTLKEEPESIIQDPLSAPWATATASTSGMQANPTYSPPDPPQRMGTSSNVVRQNSSGMHSRFQNYSIISKIPILRQKRFNIKYTNPSLKVGLIGSADFPQPLPTVLFLAAKYKMQTIFVDMIQALIYRMSTSSLHVSLTFEATRKHRYHLILWLGK